MTKDQFLDARRPGSVIGSQNQEGVVRKGIDQEGVLAIDNNALRIQPLIKPGWGRSGIAYGPHPRKNGLALAVFMLNGHNTSQSGALPEGFPRRIWRWLRGSGANPITNRAVHWIRGDHLARFLRRVRGWLGSQKATMPPLMDNLAVGWFPNEVPFDPTQAGNVFLVHAAGPVNGELQIRVNSCLLPVISSLQNLQNYLVIVLRERGAAYYAASIDAANGLAAYPNMRPLAIDPTCDEPILYAAVYQSVLGEIGFRVDTRVYATAVEELEELSNWYGTAHAADQLVGGSVLDASGAERGGQWTVLNGYFERTTRGLRPSTSNSLAILETDQPTGLLHVLVDTTTVRDLAAISVGIIWRAQDHNSHWGCCLVKGRWVLYVKTGGVIDELAVDDSTRLTAGTYSLQLLDDGATLRLALNGQLLFGQAYTDCRHGDATGIGLTAHDPEQALCLRAFEAHPRSVRIPTALAVGEPWTQEGHREAISDCFVGDPGDLANHQTTTGEQRWRREIGAGIFALTGDCGVKVLASASSPIPGRTAYTVGWSWPELADLQATITPPGTAKGQSEAGRGGFIFWQDPQNYITVSTWLSDYFDGTSVSSFFHLNGFEELYDAVWTNVGRRITWGVPYRLRAIFDGSRYRVYVNEEPVLFRALTDVYPNTKRLQIKRVGIVVNWEWGNDTGSLFSHFVAKY